MVYKQQPVILEVEEDGRDNTAAAHVKRKAEDDAECSSRRKIKINEKSTNNNKQQCDSANENPTTVKLTDEKPALEESTATNTSKLSTHNTGLTRANLNYYEGQQIEMATTKKTTLKYTPKDHGPFVVDFKGQGEYQINEFAISKMMKDAGIEFRKIQKINRINRSTVRITIDDGNTANQILKIKTAQAEAFIPKEFVFREILAFGIPTYLTNEDIVEMTEIAGGAEVIECERVMRWLMEEKREIPTERVKLTIRTNMIPKQIYVCKVATHCNIFVRKPLFCKDCRSFGHIRKYCPNRDQCVECFKTHPKNEPCTNKKTCRYCNEDHHTGNRLCQETKKQWEVARIMATERVSKKEAFQRLEAGAFPKLPSNERDNQTKFSAQERLEEAKNPNSMANIIQRSRIQESVIEDLRDGYSKQQKFIKIIMNELKRELPEQKWKMFQKDFEMVTNNDASQGNSE